MANEITVSAPPNTAVTAAQILSLMQALSGTLTDYNEGSQIRTSAESGGAVIELQGIWVQTIAFQASVYGAMSLFGITPGSPLAAIATVTFSTAASMPYPAATQNVTIPQGTIVQTSGGIQFQVTSSVTLVAGQGSVNAIVAALVPGSAGNVPATTINQIVSGLLYPLFVSNASAATDGVDATTSAQALAMFSSAVAAIGLSSPVAIANAAIGVMASGTSEQVIHSTVYEPWAAAASGNPASGVAGYSVYIDNGTGTASQALISAVNSKLNGGTVSGVSNPGGAIGYRDAGVPYNIYAVTGTSAFISVNGTMLNPNNVALISQSILAAVSGYFNLAFGQTAAQANIAAAVANSVVGQLSALTVGLYATSGFVSSVTGIPVSATGRIILGAIQLTLQ